MGTNHSVKDYDINLRSMWPYWELGFLVLIISTLMPYLYHLILLNINSNDNNNINNGLKSYEEFTPDLTILLPVKNESILIEEKLLEILSFNYSGNLSILVIDSGSSDQTAEKASQFLSDNTDISWNVKTLSTPGKSYAINFALDNIDTDFFIMLDADAIIENDSIGKIMINFSNKKIGAVCGQLKINKSDPEYPYRSKFNFTREKESLLDSTPIFEGSICAFRMKAIGESRLHSNINADDSQLAIIVRRNGYTSLMDKNIKFIEPISNKFSRKRKIRRAQGLIRVLSKNYDLIFTKDKYSVIFMNAMYFHILFPWLFMMSSLILILSSIAGIINNEMSYLEIYYSTIILFCLFPISSFFRNLISGINILISAQILLFFGRKLNIWETDEDFRNNTKLLRNS